jgi:hypothetical protein
MPDWTSSRMPKGSSTAAARELVGIAGHLDGHRVGRDVDDLGLGTAGDLETWPRLS